MMGWQLLHLKSLKGLKSRNDLKSLVTVIDHKTFTAQELLKDKTNSITSSNKLTMTGSN